MRYVDATVLQDVETLSTKYHHRVLDLVPAVQDVIQACPADTKVVSVGSGSGEQEKRLMESIPGLSVICVDPAPESFPVSRLEYAKGELDVVLKPKYKTVESLISDPVDSKLIGNCILLLDWPSNSESHDFDFEALKELQPLAVVIRYEQRGEDGGPHGLCASAAGHKLRDEVFETLVDLTYSTAFFLSDPPTTNSAAAKVGSKEYYLYRAARVPLYRFDGESHDKYLLRCFRVVSLVCGSLLNKNS